MNRAEGSLAAWCDRWSDAASSSARQQRSRSSLASAGSIAPTTVAYRVRQAQERLDPQVGRSRVGLMAALALAEQWPELAD